MPSGKSLTSFQSILSKVVATSSLPMSILLVGLEALIEQEFECPCSKSKNYILVLLVVITPPMFAWALMFFYSRFFPSNANKDQKCSCACFANFLIPAVVWLFVILIDGEYVACIQTDWDGKYVSDEKLNKKWCRPTDLTNKEVDEKRELYGKYLFSSQVSGYGLVCALSIILFVMGLNCCKNYCCKQSNDDQCDNQELVLIFPKSISTEGQRNTIPVEVKVVPPLSTANP